MKTKTERKKNVCHKPKVLQLFVVGCRVFHLLKSKARVQSYIEHCQIASNSKKTQLLFEKEKNNVKNDEETHARECSQNKLANENP